MCSDRRTSAAPGGSREATLLTCISDWSAALLLAQKSTVRGEKRHGSAVVAPDASLAVERRAVLHPLFRHWRIESLREREPRSAPAVEGGSPAVPYRKRTAEQDPLPTPLAQQHNIFTRAFHPTLL